MANAVDENACLFENKSVKFCSMKTLYNIEINPALLWDYDFSPEQMQEESFFIWYLGRLLDSGTAAEVKRIPIESMSAWMIIGLQFLK